MSEGERRDAADRYAAGMRVRREVLGDEHVDASTPDPGAIDEAFQRHLTETAWGGPWASDELDRRTRSCITIAALVTLRATEELALHVRAGIRNGLTATQIAEVVRHTSIYAGVPAANTAMAVVKRVLDELADEGSHDG